MIRYTLKCENNHSFDSWFQSSEAFEKLQGAGLLSCTECGCATVTKTLMAPKVATSRAKGQLTAPTTQAESEIAKVKADVEKNSDYVGTNFASEARAMHDGTSPERSIYGEAKPEEAKALIKDGIPVVPLPFMPKRNTN